MFKINEKIIGYFTLSQRGLLNLGRARPTDIFVTYLRFNKRYVDENSTIRISLKIYTNS